MITRDQYSEFTVDTIVFNQLNGRALQVYCFLLSLKPGVTEPTHGIIADRMHWTLPTVENALQELRDRGAILPSILEG